MNDFIASLPFSRRIIRQRQPSLTQDFPRKESRVATARSGAVISSASGRSQAPPLSRRFAPNFRRIDSQTGIRRPGLARLPRLLVSRAASSLSPARPNSRFAQINSPAFADIAPKSDLRLPCDGACNSSTRVIGRNSGHLWGHRKIFPKSYAKDLRRAQLPRAPGDPRHGWLGKSSGQKPDAWFSCRLAGVDPLRSFSGLRRKDRNRRTASRLLHQI